MCRVALLSRNARVDFGSRVFVRNSKPQRRVVERAVPRRFFETRESFSDRKLSFGTRDRRGESSNAPVFLGDRMKTPKRRDASRPTDRLFDPERNVCSRPTMTTVCRTNVRVRHDGAATI